MPYGERNLRIAIVSGLGTPAPSSSASGAASTTTSWRLWPRPNGCISGGGQPFAHAEEQAERSEGLYKADQVSRIKRSEENPLMMELYGGLFEG